MNPKTFILFGRAGCGKGTQSEQLTKYLKSVDKENEVVYVETGARMREFVKQAGLTQGLTSKVMVEGGLMPSFIPIWLWTTIFIENLKGKEHIVLDGLSRRPHEAPILHDALKFYNREKPFVIVLNVSNEECKRRLISRNRSDDKADGVDRRLSWYESTVVPTIEYFRQNDYFKVLDINGEQSIEKVHADIVAAIS